MRKEERERLFFFIAVVMISLYHWLGWQDKKEMVTMFGQEIFNPNWFAHEGEYGVEMSEWNSAKQDATAMVLHACITEKREEGRGGLISDRGVFFFQNIGCPLRNLTKTTNRIMHGSL